MLTGIALVFMLIGMFKKGLRSRQVKYAGRQAPVSMGLVSNISWSTDRGAFFAPPACPLAVFKCSCYKATGF